MRADLEVIFDTHRVHTNPEVKMIRPLGVGLDSVGDWPKFSFRFDRKTLNELLGFTAIFFEIEVEVHRPKC